MKIAHRLFATALAGGSLIALSGCSIDGVLWGAEGARVIDVTERLIAEASSRRQDELVLRGLRGGLQRCERLDGAQCG